MFIKIKQTYYATSLGVPVRTGKLREPCETVCMELRMAQNGVSRRGAYGVGDDKQDSRQRNVIGE